jgi:ubiquinone/menaquinone biosynthesis C-methylase UbiE
MKDIAQNSANKYKFPKKKYNEDIKFFFSNNICKLRKGANILDAGCDNGYLSGPFTADYKITGVDLNSAAIYKCREKYPHARYEISDLLALPFNDNQFDAIIFNMVIEHIRDVDKALAELKRVLKEGGVMALTTPNYASIPWCVIETIWFRIFEQGFKPFLEDVHPSKFKPGTLQNCLERHFNNISLEKITFGFTLTAVVSK